MGHSQGACLDLRHARIIIMTRQHPTTSPLLHKPRNARSNAARNGTTRRTAKGQLGIRNRCIDITDDRNWPCFSHNGCVTCESDWARIGGCKRLTIH